MALDIKDSLPNVENSTLAVIGLGYVGLPLAIEFAKKYPTVGFDINVTRIEQLSQANDVTLEISSAELREADKLKFTNKPEDLAGCNVFIVTVPTPIDEQNQPDLRPLESASQMLGQLLKQDDMVIYESTVYPGATEEVCIPILQQHSGLQLNQGFFAGYSPERINPGDKTHRLSAIIKVTSGSNPQAANFVDDLYKSIIQAGTHPASSIKVAEAAKVIENTQRDLNIALVNELAIIFARLEIDTEEVLQAAGSKWNFLPFRPGLVGGHCISVDPYYLTHKAQQIGYHPEVILAGRRINDGMGSYITDRIIKLMTQKRIHVVDSKILILGLSFKENCPDLRNTRVIDMIEEFKQFHTHIDVYDPWVDANEAKEEYGIILSAELSNNSYDAIVLAVAHDEFKQMGAEQIRQLGKSNCVLFDIKSQLDPKLVDGRL